VKRAQDEASREGATIDPIVPTEIRIAGATPVARALHQDPRGFLVETMRADDAPVRGDRFVMSYTSVTVPGEFRDVDRWHAHRVQTDRFVVPLGEMVLALYDHRPESPTHGRLEVIRMAGADLARASHATKRDLVTYLVPIPPGVYHCIGNLSAAPFVLQNYPTEYYSPDDEGRVPFAEQVVASLGRPFAWDLVRRSSPPA
jgi:dTDP-4-dehydrorhamnose 3,5-epimerase